VSVLALDISNYTTPLTDQLLANVREAGVSHVIVQAIDPPPGYPTGRTRDQIQRCLAAGFTVDAYLWLWFDLGAQDIQRKLGLLDGLPIRQLWLDVEDTAAVKYDYAPLEQKVAQALDQCDAYQTTSGQRTGIYTGRWFWTDRRYMGNLTTFADRELWDANYDGVADAAQGFTPYGGWTADSLRIKQYQGSTSVGGVGGVDVNVLSVAEADELFTPEPEPEPDPGVEPAAPDYDPGWQAKKTRLVQIGGELADLAQQARLLADQLDGRSSEILN
jgi:hypothetical protein